MSILIFLAPQSWFGSLDKEKDGLLKLLRLWNILLHVIGNPERLKVVTSQASLMKLKMQFSMQENSSA